MNKNNFLHLFSYILLFAFCVAFLSGCVPDNRNIELSDVNATFDEDIDDLQLVADYLCSLDYDYVIIRDLKGTMVVDGGEKISIDDEIKQTIKTLFNKGYCYLAKEYYTIQFHRWDKPFDMEFQAGFAYVNDDSENLDISFVVYQEPLSKANWYYYEANYNEYIISH